jgi:hypothetical protein
MIHYKDQHTIEFHSTSLNHNANISREIKHTDILKVWPFGHQNDLCI